MPPTPSRSGAALLFAALALAVGGAAEDGVAQVASAVSGQCLWVPSNVSATFPGMTQVSCLSDAEAQKTSFKAINVTAAFCLCSMVVVFSLAVILVHFPDKDISSAAYGVLSTTLSVFVACMWFGATTDDVLDKILGDGHPRLRMFLYGSVFLSYYLVVELLLLVQKGDRLSLAMWGTLGGHIIGFAGIGFFNYMLTLSPFVDTCAMSFVVFFIAVLTLYVMMRSMKALRQHVALNGDSEVDEDEERWMDQCSDTENDVFCITTSWVLSCSIRYAIIGKSVGVDGAPEGRTSTDIFWLWAAAFIAKGLNYVLVAAGKPLDTKSMSGFVARAVKLGGNFLSMLFAWLVYYFGNWLMYYISESMHGGKPGQESGVVLAIVLAVGLTLLGVFEMIHYHYLGPQHANRITSRAMRVLLSSVGLFVGFSWEKSFDAVFDGISDDLGPNGWLPLMTLSLVLIVLVLPSWRLYVLPNSDEELKEAEPTPPSIFYLCGCAPRNAGGPGYDSEEDEE